MKKTLLLLVLCLGFSGCAAINRGACWVDQQWEPCEDVVPEESKTHSHVE